MKENLRWVLFIIMSMSLLVGSVMAQTTYEFEEIEASFVYPSNFDIEEEEGFIYLIGDAFEIIFYLVMADNPIAIIEESLAFYEDVPAFDEDSIFIDEDAELAIALYETDSGEQIIILGVLEASNDVYIGFEIILPNDASDDDFDTALTIIGSISVGSSSPLQGGDDPSQTEGDSGEMPDFDDIEAVMAEYGITGDLISIPPVFPPFVQTWAEFVEEDECRAPVPVAEVQGETIRCGVLYVPENRTVEASNEIEIAVVILLAHTDSDSTLIYLEGGPGGAATSNIADWSITPYRDTHHIIMIDQRGTGYSLPSLNCPEVEEGGDEFECYERLIEEGIDLSAYNSRENAADVADLIRELGYANNTLYGISYGTRLALTVIRDHPEVLTSVILDAVYPPEVGTGVEEAYIFYNALQTMFADCEADEACGDAFPDLEVRFLEAIVNLDENPASYINDNDEEEDLFGATVLNALFEAMYSTAIIPALPAALDAIAEGDYDYGMALIAFGDPDMAFADELEMTFDYEEGLDDAEAMYNSVECNEQLGLASIRDYLISFDEAFEAEKIPIAILLNAFNPTLFGMCEQWDSGVAARSAASPIGGDVPTLVFSGDYDPITPPAWGELAASRLNNARFFSFPYSGHGLFDQACPMSIAMQFLSDPNATLDASCMGQMQPNFYIGN